MSAFLVRSIPQVFSRVCHKTRHAEPQLRGRRRSDRIAADARIRETERELRSVLWGAAALSHSVEL
jgi:hypothetical protein